MVVKRCLPVDCKRKWNPSMTNGIGKKDVLRFLQFFKIGIKIMFKYSEAGA